MVAGLLLVLHFVAVLLGQVHLPQTEVGKDEGGRGELEGLVVVLECIVVMPLRKMFSNGCHDCRFEKKLNTANVKNVSSGFTLYLRKNHDAFS